MDNLKVLIVEDDPNLGQILSEYLGIKRFITTLCVDGEEGFEAFQRGGFDLCILDVMMPKMNGMEVCYKVKKELNLDHVYIILLTAKGQEVDRQKGLDMGADRYMTKPFDPDEMLSVAEEILNK